MEKRLYKEVKRDIYKKRTYIEKKLYKKGQKYVEREKNNNTKQKKKYNKLIVICSEIK